ncbi:hypothetical protein [Streptomyces sp. 6N223]|uniref:hypothetical protein n=1 Tax=Streptomyces sp. 6N223 TaxID=3457412 RepID=UPI003FCF1793
MPLTPVEPVRDEAQEIVQQLKAALAAHGIVLPSLNVDLPSFAHLTGEALIELGRVNQETARALIALATREGPRT